MKCVCLFCGCEFESKSEKGSKYCSNKCKSMDYRQKHLVEVTKICEYCGKEFTVKCINGKTNTRFCSISCSSKSTHINMEEKELTCEMCGSKFMFKGTTKAKYCSECRAKMDSILGIEYRVRKGITKKGFVGKGGNQVKGEDNKCYKTGIGNYKNKRYDYLIENGKPIACEECGSTLRLEVHHIDKDRTNNDIDNLILLCKSCHKKRHIIRDELGRFTSSKNKAE
jgi:hypothetical protein